ncbi:hypothetical protein F2P81_008410 [Scophthalmus maximus]|uniref:Uncharacterized protein n=1 Tax=Scophthalmus maximus TaxID=52904 RepID=A0A6A4T4Y5_SCOMX|nr:hypothetical protein F2P81_008410 [Scophthalmus maximus]
MRSLAALGGGDDTRASDSLGDGVSSVQRLSNTFCKTSVTFKSTSAPDVHRPENIDRTSTVLRRPSIKLRIETKSNSQKLQSE